MGQQCDLASVLDHPVFKTVVTLERNSMSSKEITDLLQKIPGLMDVLHAMQQNQFIFHTRRVED